MFKVLSVLAIIAVSLASASKKCGQDVRNQMEQKVAQCQFKAERTFPTARPCAYIEGLIKCSEDFKDCYDEEETRRRKDRTIESLTGAKAPNGDRYDTCTSVGEWKASGRPLYKATDKCTADKIKEKFASTEKCIRDAMKKELDTKDLLEKACTPYTKGVSCTYKEMSACYSYDEIDDNMYEAMRIEEKKTKLDGQELPISIEKCQKYLPKNPGSKKEKKEGSKAESKKEKKEEGSKAESKKQKTDGKATSDSAKFSSSLAIIVPATLLLARFGPY